LSDTVFYQFSQNLQISPENPFSALVSVQPNSSVPNLSQAATYHMNPNMYNIAMSEQASQIPQQQQMLEQKNNQHSANCISPFQNPTSPVFSSATAMSFSSPQFEVDHRSATPMIMTPGAQVSENATIHPHYQSINHSYYHISQQDQEREILQKQFEIQKFQIQQEDLDTKLSQQELRMDKDFQHNLELNQNGNEFSHFDLQGNSMHNISNLTDLSAAPGSPFAIDFLSIDATDDFPKLDTNELERHQRQQQQQQNNMLELKQVDVSLDFPDQNIASVFDNESMYNNDLIDSYVSKAESMQQTSSHHTSNDVVDDMTKHQPKRKKITHAHLRSHSFDVSLLHQQTKPRNRNQLFF